MTTAVRVQGPGIGLGVRPSATRSRVRSRVRSRRPARKGMRIRKPGQYRRMTPTTIPWTSTSSGTKYIGWRRSFAG
jgi:hypothetical protein